jgi:aerobic-type carbon monoxide dehydrogenase small subunit (CoxS/CutS family)
MAVTVEFSLDGQAVSVPGDGTLLEALRALGAQAVKDGCSPQGQCGCCTVQVDGQARVACVTPVRRVAGKRVVTFDGLPPDRRESWTEALCATGGSQCGFCTPGIVVRLDGDGSDEGEGRDPAAINRALAAHLCRCTGWQTIVEAAALVDAGVPIPSAADIGRDLDAASKRATIEGRAHQRVDPSVAAGQGGFAADTAPADALVAVPDGHDGWVVAESLAEARAAAGKVQGRRSTVGATAPVDLPAGEWALTLQTSWVEPAYLETDAAWCLPGGEPASALANGGAFGAKTTSPVGDVARQLADEHERAVLVVLSREDTVRLGPKRPPLAAGVSVVDGELVGEVHVVRTPGIVEAIASVAPGLRVTEVDVAGPPTSVALRGAGWVEAAVLAATVAGTTTVRSPGGAVASAQIDAGGAIRVQVSCGEPLDEVTLRSYCIGAAHQALGWVTSESIAVDHDGTVCDLTIRSFGIVRPGAMVPVDVEIEPSEADPVNGSDAVFAAVAAAVWQHQGCPGVWPTGIGLQGSGT